MQVHMIRLEPVILELEREPADVLIIGHASVIRCLMAYLQVGSVQTFLFGTSDSRLQYLQGLTPQEIPSLELRRGDVVQVTPSAYGVNMTTHFFWQ